MAFFEVSTEETQNRLGRVEARGLHLSRDVVSKGLYEAEKKM